MLRMMGKLSIIVRERWKLGEDTGMKGMRLAAVTLCGAIAAVVMAAGAASAVPKSAPPEVWSQAERDGDGDIRIVVIQREGMQREGVRAERAAERISRRAAGRVNRSFRHIDGDVLKVRPERLAEVLADLEADPDVAAFAPDSRDQRVVVPDGSLGGHEDPRRPRQPRHPQRQGREGRRGRHRESGAPRRPARSTLILRPPSGAGTILSTATAGLGTTTGTAPTSPASSRPPTTPPAWSASPPG